MLARGRLGLRETDIGASTTKARSGQVARSSNIWRASPEHPDKATTNTNEIAERSEPAIAARRSFLEWLINMESSVLVMCPSPNSGGREAGSMRAPNRRSGMGR